MDIAALLGPVDGMNVGDAAAHYVTAGIPVFPCVPGDKRPLVNHGFKDATTDPARVDAWWQRWPNANIGIPTGTSSGIEVVDIDVKGEDPRGPDSWQRATHAGLLEGWAARVVTPSGGLHAYYPAATDFEQRSWASGKAQIDFRGAGGYIIAPPSIVLAGGERAAYQLLEVSPDSVAPVDAGRLRDFLTPRPTAATWKGTHEFTGTLPERIERLASWLGTREESERNQSLFWASCRLAESGAGLQDAFNSLGPVAENLGLPPREIERTIRSAFHKIHTPIAQPGSAPIESLNVSRDRQQVSAERSLG